jgi:acetyl esterase/lipase
LPEKGDGPFPVIVVFHGGAWLFGDKGDLQHEPMLEGLDRDYAVACVNYRLSEDASFPSQIYDCKAAIRYLRANAGKYCLNPSRFAVWGGSAGGHLAALVGTSAHVKDLEEPSIENADQPCAVQAVVDWCGPVENFLKMDDELRENHLGPTDHSSEDSPESKLLGAKIPNVPELVKRASPMTYITADAPPFLIQHGDLDPVVPVQQSINFAAEMARIAGPGRVTLEVLHDVQHHGDPAFETEENIARVFNFLDEWLKKL